jgi:outer membrane protein
MLKLSLALNLILAAALMGLYVVVFNLKSEIKTGSIGSQNNEEIISGPAPEIELKSSPIVYINADSLMANFNLVKDTKKELEKERLAFEKQFEARYRNLEKEYNDLKDRAPLMTQEEGMMKQQELMMKEQELSEYREKNAERLMKMEQDKNELIHDKITAYLKKNYANSNYAYILGYSSGGGILFAHDSLEITKEVIKGLNLSSK